MDQSECTGFGRSDEARERQWSWKESPPRTIRSPRRRSSAPASKRNL